MGIFRCCIFPDGRNVIREWYDVRAAEVQGKMVGTPIAFENFSRSRWPENLFKPLDRRAGTNCVGLDELRVNSIRILGFGGPRTDDDFTMLYAFDKNQDKRYRVSCEEARRRKEEVQNDWRRSEEFEYP